VRIRAKDFNEAGELFIKSFKLLLVVLFNEVVPKQQDISMMY
jgi:hypothetical protein